MGQLVKAMMFISKFGIPSDLLISINGYPLASIVHSTYPNVLDSMSDISYFQDRTILAPKNTIVYQINEYMFLGEKVFIPRLSLAPSDVMILFKISTETVSDSCFIHNDY
jgi:hypothetical protein